MTENNSVVRLALNPCRSLGGIADKIGISPYEITRCMQTKKKGGMLDLSRPCATPEGMWEGAHVDDPLSLYSGFVSQQGGYLIRLRA